MARRAYQRWDAGYGPVGPGATVPSGMRLGGFVRALVENLQVRDPVSLAPLARDWTSIAGDRLARHTRPGRLEQGTLTVYADSAPWMVEAQRAAGPILERARRALPDVEMGRIRMAPDPDAQPPGPSAGSASRYG